MSDAISTGIGAFLLLADAAQVDPTGKVHLLGGGWSVTTSPTAPQAVVAFISVPWNRTNERLAVRLELVDSDGHPVVLARPDCEPVPLMEISSELEVGRPPGVLPGSPIPTSFTVNVQPLPLPSGRYSWELRIAEAFFSAPFTVLDPAA